MAENNPKSEHSEVNMTFHGAVGSAAGKVEGDQKTIQHNYAPEKQTLADAAAEIQRLLKQLEETNPKATQTEKHTFVTAAIAPVTRKRVVKAIQAGGEKALEEFLKNPYVNVATAIVKEWQKAE